MNEAYRSVLEQLVAMSARLGEPERDLVILGEGNTSAAVDD
ncbi:MAG TPA: class II aldolase, partial [Armatimonadetes bacterium]|nr:class II aldolase [Armatimonadota bacterium]